MTGRPNLAVGIGVLAAAAFFGAGLTAIDDQGGYAGLSPRFFPIMVTLALAGLGVALIAVRDSVPASDPQAGPGPARHQAFAWVLAGLLLDIALIGLIGFVLASTVLMVCVARGYDSRRPGRDALIALALTLPLWALFSRVLGLSLPLLPALGI